MFKIGNNESEGKMQYPRDVAICGDIVLISHFQLNQLNGKFISKIGSLGQSELEFDCPCGLTINESNGDIYICDCFNNRIQILNVNFSFKSQFGKDTLKSPRDVKLSKEYILVLDSSNPCLYFFNCNNILQKSVISRGKGMQVVNPYYFFIDQAHNILISDRGSNFILIFNTQFKLFPKIPVSDYPMGVTVDNQSKVIVVCQAEKKCLRIF